MTIEWYCVPKGCPFCKSMEIEAIETLHQCRHVKVHVMVCMVCRKDFTGLCYPHVVKE